MSNFWVMISVLFLAILLVPGAFWLLEVFMGLLPIRQVKQQLDKKIKAVILMPAHNEAQVIKITLDGLSAQLSDDDQVLVVADNCTDKTAEIANRCGMAVTERFHETQRGKGFALAHGIAEIAKRGWTPDVVLVLDADCEILPEGLSRLKQAAAEYPVQGRYLLTAPKGVGPKQKVSAFAIYVKNHIRMLGLARLGGSVPITGSGFGAPYALFKSVELASGEIVEDMKLGCDWAFAGHFTHYVPHTHILSPLPLDGKDADKQRQRWEHGHVSIIRRYMPRLLMLSMRNLRFDYLFTAFDMAIPPLTVMVAAYGLLAVLLLPLFWQASVVVFSLLILIALTLTILNSLARPKFLSLSDVAGLFKFAASKLGLYSKLIRGERSEWIKTKRDK